MGTRPFCLVLAEDDVDARELLASALRRDGNEVVEAEDGASLAGALLRGAPDVVVTDVDLPGASGLDVLDGMRRYDWETPVVVITAFATECVAERVNRLGARLLEKPFAVDELRTELLRLLR